MALSGFGNSPRWRVPIPQVPIPHLSTGDRVVFFLRLHKDKLRLAIRIIFFFTEKHWKRLLRVNLHPRKS